MKTTTPEALITYQPEISEEMLLAEQEALLARNAEARRQAALSPHLTPKERRAYDAYRAEVRARQRRSLQRGQRDLTLDAGWMQ